MVAAGTGVGGVFMECHPNPAEARCDGPNSWPLALVSQLLGQLQAIDATVKASPRLEDLVN